jgi:hypothetical protein
VDDWPPIRDQRLADRLSIGDDQFDRLALKLAARAPAREFRDRDFARALNYPWQRPQCSYRLRNGVAVALGDGDPDDAGAAVVGLITFGSIAAPEVLASRLAGTPGSPRLLTGWLEGFFATASAHLAAYGALPATLVQDPRARLRVGLLLLSPEQFELLTQFEFNYRLAALDSSAFSADSGCAFPERIFAYVSRHGAFAPFGEPCPLVAIEQLGVGRKAITQGEVLELAAEIVLGEADAKALVRRTIEDYEWSVRVARKQLATTAQRLDPTAWDLFSTGRAGRTE